MPKPTTTTLASGQINNADQIEVEMHRPADLPAFILVEWPPAASVASPDNFPDSGPRCFASWRMPAQP